MIKILAENPLILLFVVASLGFLLGKLRFLGGALGVSAVLFVGLVLGALDPSLQIPNVVFLLGLSLFIYSVGLNSGPAFFDSYRRNGLRDIWFALGMLGFSGVLAVGLALLMGFDGPTIGGIYAGSVTNTPALASMIEYAGNTWPEESSSITESIVVGFSWSYPMGVLGGIIGIALFSRLFKIDFKKEAYELRHEYPVEQDLTSATIDVTNPEVSNMRLRQLFKQHAWNVVFGRVYHDGEVNLAGWDDRLRTGDTVMVVGSRESVNEVIDALGKRSDTQLEHDRAIYDTRRIFVSNRDLAGKSLASLQIHEKFHAVITRIRRGDVDMLAKGETVLEIGDRIRFIAKREDLNALSEFFGDSYQASSRVDLFSFGLGLSLGLLIGLIEFPIGGVSFKLGFAGGPLIVGLILGSLRRTGPIIWNLSYSANVTIQQLGLILLLSAIGVRAGNAFIQSFSPEGLEFFAASALISCVTAFATLVVGYKVFKKPFAILAGMVANQPAILDFAVTRCGNRLPVFGFATVFPIAIIVKIVIAQLLLVFL